MNTLIKLTFLLIIILAFFLRTFKLDSVPPSLSWDEAAAGYNAYTIANFGRDEFGNFLPLVFSSFGDDKHPVWIYITAVFEKVLGLSEYSTRLPAALFGVFNVAIVFYLARLLFNSSLVGLIASTSIALSPQNLQFSRGEWEGNFALFFWMLSFLLFLIAIYRNKLSTEKRGLALILSFLGLGIDLLAYHSAKIFVPPIFLLLMVFYFKDLVKLKKYFYISLGVFIFFILLIVHDPRLTGRARAMQSLIPEERVKASQLYQNTHNYYLGYLEVSASNYILHFQNPFLFISGDQNARLSAQVSGEFYWVDLPLFLIGILFLIKKRSRITVVLLAWFLLAPMPASLVAGAPHAHRSLYLMGSGDLIIGLGLASLVLFFKNLKFQIAIAGAFLAILAVSFLKYLQGYYSIYPIRYAIEWQYGMKQIVEYVRDHPEYDQVYMTDERHQPYIFFLYYLKYPLDKYLEGAIINSDPRTSGYSLITSFDKFHFSDWNFVDCPADPRVLCIVTDSQYGGMRNLASLKVKEKIMFPQTTTTAFYIVSAR